MIVRRKQELTIQLFNLGHNILEKESQLYWKADLRQTTYICISISIHMCESVSVAKYLSTKCSIWAEM